MSHSSHSKVVSISIANLGVALISLIGAESSAHAVCNLPVPPNEYTVQAKSQKNVAGAVFVNSGPSMDPNFAVGTFSVKQQENVKQYFVNPIGTGTNCFLSSNTAQPIVNNPMNVVLVVVSGTPDAYASATWGFNPNQNGAPTTTFTPSSSLPGGLSASVTSQISSVLNKIPGDQTSRGYFTLTIPANQSLSNSFTYYAWKPGVIQFTAIAAVSGPNTSEQVITLSGGTAFKPTLQFSTPATSVNSDACSPLPLTVETRDGQGGVTPPVNGDYLTVNLSGAPADLFLDPACLYPTTVMWIANPLSLYDTKNLCPSNMCVPGSPAPKRAVSDHSVQFYYKGTVAQSLPVTAKYMIPNSNGKTFQVTQNQAIMATAPAKLDISGPASINQGACSAPLKLTLRDVNLNESPVTGSPLSLVLAGTAGSRFYADSDCNQALPQAFQLPAGTSQKIFYVKDTAAELLKINLSSSQIQSTSYTLRVLGMGGLSYTKDPAVAARLASLLYLRLVGTPAPMGDGNVAKMADLILQGKALDAAHLATSLDGFYDITLKNMATPLSNRFVDSLEPLNDFVATWIGTVRDDRDARELLTGNHIYVPYAPSASLDFRAPDDQHCAQSNVYKFSAPYEDLQTAVRNSTPANPVHLKSSLVPVRQCAYNNQNFGADSPVLLSDAAGLLTTRAWGKAHLFAGTNRRSIQFAMDVFLCHEINTLRDTTMPDWHIRRDVDRAPGGDPKGYNNRCRSCHGGMDGLGGAYAFFDAYGANMNDEQALDFRLIYVNKGGYGESLVMPKFNDPVRIQFQPGYVTGDDSWINFFTTSQNVALGWSPDAPTQGNGVHALGVMLSQSNAFASCIAKRVFKSACKRDASTDEASILWDLTNDFQGSGYNMKRLFEKAASQSACLGKGD